MADQVGRVLGDRYHLLERVARGGMAAVWRGETRGAAGFTRPVAIKRIRTSMARDPEFVKMFVEEARVGGGLHHPNIVQIHDFGSDEDGLLYLVMEWVAGLDVGRWSDSMRESGWHAPWHLTAAIGIEALRGLHGAHCRRDLEGKLSPTYHRDISPGNLLLSQNGVVKVADFGLARAMDRARITRPETVKGKLAYLAPEFLEDKPPDARSDMFSLGVVLWEVLCGSKLFLRKKDLDTLRCLQQMQIPSLEKLRPDAPEELCAVIKRALARDPQDRYASALEMATALGKVLRKVAQPTDAELLAQSVIEATKKLKAKRMKEAKKGSSSPGPPPPPNERARKERNAAWLMHPEEPDSNLVPLELSRRKKS